MTTLLVFLAMGPWLLAQPRAVRPERSTPPSHSRQLRAHKLRPTLPVSAKAQPGNWVFIPENPREALTEAVAGGGDMNGDGFADVVVGDSRFDHGRGRLLFFQGSNHGLKGEPDRVLEGDSPQSGFGRIVSLVGDVNGDGFDDIFVLAKPQAGTASLPAAGYIVLGGPDGPGRRIPFPSSRVVAAAGDVNGDGYDDVVEQIEDPSHGQGVGVHYGSASGPRVAPDWIASPEQTNSLFGSHLACAGDVNKDGYDDLLIGAPKFSGRFPSGGKAYLYCGSAKGLEAQPSWTSEYPLPVRPGVDEPYEQFYGWGLSSAGDVNGDGYDDVLVGACYADHGDLSEGLVFLYYGSPRGLHALPDWWAESNQPHAFFGQGLCTAWDVNGDGFDDVLVGAPQAMNGQMDEGTVVFYHGSRAGLEHWPSWSMESDHTHERFGGFVQGAGDINGDGFADILMVGGGYEQFRTGGVVEKAGRVVVCYGGPKGLIPSHRWRLRKPVLLGMQQEMDIWHHRVGTVVYWGPPSLGLVGVLVAFLAVQRRLRRQLALAVDQNRQLAVAGERTRLARDVHDHLGAQLTQIALWTDIAKSSLGQPASAAEKLERVSGLIKNAVTDISQLVWTMNPANDSLENFVAYLSDFVIEFLKPAGIEPAFELPETMPGVPIDPARRNQLLAAIKEALNNVVRHSRASRLEVRVSANGSSLSIVINDNGIGFTPAPCLGAQDSKHHGLRDIESRVAEAGGTVTVRSKPGEGTTIAFELPFPLGPAAPSRRQPPPPKPHA